MRNVVIGGALLAAVVAAIGARVWAGQESAAPTTHAAQVDRGAYLVKIMGCNDCHTPLKMGPAGPEPDMERYLSGHPEQIGTMPPAPKPEGLWIASSAATNTAYAGPWGVSYSMNLTPDENTGLGIWTEEMFVSAIKTGKHMGRSRDILPPMPWSTFRHATDEDLKAIYAYLRTVRPIVNHIPDVQPPSAAATH